MKFPKDILIIDFEGLEEPVQIGTVLLDKETLVEKDSFVSYIYADLKGSISSKSGITQETINDAPRQKEIGKIIYDKFGSDIFLSSFAQNLDINHFKKIIAAAELDFKLYDYHILDIWPVSYIHLLKQGYKGSMRSEEIFQEFGAKPRGPHNALEDCRIAADVLRKIVKS